MKPLRGVGEFTLHKTETIPIGLGEMASLIEGERVVEREGRRDQQSWTGIK